MTTNKTVTGIFLACTFGFIGCGDVNQDDDASPHARLIDKRSDALLSSEIQSINGTYGAGCVARASGNWSLAVTGSPTLDHTALTVVKNNTACGLTLTGIHATGDGGTAYAASSNIALGASYAGGASSFGSPIKFYANALLSDATFADDFSLTLLFSDNPTTASASNTATFVVATASAATSGVAAPDYTMGIGTVGVVTDANNLVTSVSGNVVLTHVATDATHYVIYTGSAGSTYASINTAYLTGTPTSVASGSVSFATSLFLTAGTTNISSSPVKTLIVANLSNGVRSYKAFAITFVPPTP